MKWPVIALEPSDLVSCCTKVMLNTPWQVAFASRVRFALDLVSSGW